MPAVGPQLPDQQQHGALPGQLAYTLTGHDGPVLAVRFNKAGTYCLSAGRVGVSLTRPPSREPLRIGLAKQSHPALDLDPVGLQAWAARGGPHWMLAAGLQRTPCRNTFTRPARILPLA